MFHSQKLLSKAKKILNKLILLRRKILRKKRNENIKRFSSLFFLNKGEKIFINNLFYFPLTFQCTSK